MPRDRQRIREALAWSVAGCALACAVIAVAADKVVAGNSADEPKYSVSTAGTRWLDSSSGLKIKMLVEQSNLGGSEVEIGEITFPADYKKSPPHRHGQVEIFYVRSGKLGHEVNGVKHVIGPGMVGIVRPGDRVVHSVESDEPVQGLVIWTPCGEADALIKAGVFKVRPIDDDAS
jgi:quercetin dioxygenase-like cupin family protein